MFGTRSGANAEYVCVREDGVLAHKPAGMTFEEAATVPDGACTALAFLRQAGLQQGHRLLVYGASGSIGTAAVQLARHLGADVTAVVDTRHLELVRSLGAHRVIDHQREDFTASGRRYDLVLDAVGKLSAWRARRPLVAGQGDPGAESDQHRSRDPSDCAPDPRTREREVRPDRDLHHEQEPDKAQRAEHPGQPDEASRLIAAWLDELREQGEEEDTEQRPPLASHEPGPGGLLGAAETLMS